MTLKGIILQLITKTEPLVPVMLFTAGVTLVFLLVLLVLARNVWFDTLSFRVLGIFFGLSEYDSYRLALSWVRFLMTLFYIVSFQELGAPQYVAYLLVGILYVLDVKKPARIPKNLLWFAVITVGLFATSLICGYIHTLSDISFKPLMIYILMGVFICLLAVYLFLLELEDISADRRMNPVKDYEQLQRDRREFK